MVLSRTIDVRLSFLVVTNMMSILSLVTTISAKAIVGSNSSTRIGDDVLSLKLDNFDLQHLCIFSFLK